jgi:trehalose synthase
MLDDEWDVVVVHDPQPAALIAADPAPGARWIWRCQIDTSTPDPAAWEALRPHVARHDAFVFTMEGFRPPDLPRERTRLIAPAIDPLSAKSRALPAGSAREAVRAAGIDPDRPLVAQVSRFDPWKDPLGVIAAWRSPGTRCPDSSLRWSGRWLTTTPKDGRSTRTRPGRRPGKATFTCSRACRASARSR